MPRSKLPPAKLAWWRANRERIDALHPSLRGKVRQLLEKGGIEKAQEFLWNEILRNEGLSMNAGLNGVVYVGTDFDLDAVYFGFGTVETKKGNWASVRIIGTRNSDDG